MRFGAASAPAARCYRDTAALAFAALERALRVAKRLPGKLKEAAMKKIQDIAEQAGIELL